MKRALLAAFLLAALGSSSRGATVHLRDGTKVVGTVVGATARDLEVFTGGGTTRIPTASILRVDYDEAAAPAPAAPAQPATVTKAPRETLWKEDRSQQLGFNLGLSIPVGDVDFAPIGGGSGANGDVSAAFGGHYFYFPSQRFGWGFGVDYLSRGPTSSPGLLASAESSTSGGSVTLMGLAKIILKRGEAVQPYLLAGLGAARTWTTIDSQPNPGFVWDDTSTDEARRLIDGRAWGPAGTARVGLDFWPEAAGVFSLEAGWTGIGGATYSATPQGRAIGLSGVSTSVSIVTVGGRWGWRF